MQSRCPLACKIGMLLTLVLPSAASAVRLEYLVELGIENNDNLNLTEFNPESANILEPLFGFVVTQEGSTVQASANGAVQYRDYLGGEFSDEFRGQLAGHLNWTMVPERLNLTVEDYLGVEPINSLEANTPINQQQTNVFAIGPTLNFRMGPTVRGEAEVRYINSHADETDDFNTNRGTAALRALKDLSSSTTISANLTGERVNYVDENLESGPDYSRYNLYGRYARKWSKVDFVTDLGYSWLKYSGRLNDRDSPLLRGALTWRYSERSTFGLDFAYQYSDAATAMMTGGDITTPPTTIATGDATTTSQPYLERRLGASYFYAGDRFGFNFAPYYQELDYSEAGANIPQNLIQDQTGKGASLGISYLLRPLLSIGFNASGENLHYNKIDRVDDTWMVSTFLRQQWARNWSWRVQYSYYKRDSTEPGQSADQNVIYFGITYTR